jgi:hypothetical protein
MAFFSHRFFRLGLERIVASCASSAPVTLPGPDERTLYLRIRHMETSRADALVDVLKKPCSPAYWMRKTAYVS